MPGSDPEYILKHPIYEPHVYADMKGQKKDLFTYRWRSISSVLPYGISREFKNPPFHHKHSQAYPAFCYPCSSSGTLYVFLDKTPFLVTIGLMVAYVLPLRAKKRSSLRELLWAFPGG
jgi:hypothetical protein